MAAIFAGKVAGYSPVDGWEKNLAAVLYRLFQINPFQNPQDMLTALFMDLANAIDKLIDEFEGVELELRIRAACAYYAQALMESQGESTPAQTD